MDEQERGQAIRKKIISIGTTLIKDKLSKEITEEDVIYFLEDVNNDFKINKNYDYIRELLDIARIDWEASTKLYYAGIYSQSIYHLQQCIEKITKAYALFTGHVSIEELKPKKKSKKLDF